MEELKVKEQIPEQGLLNITEDEIVDVFDNPEPWSPIETKLVVWSFVSAFIFLIIFGFLINKYLLHAI